VTLDRVQEQDLDEASIRQTLPRMLRFGVHNLYARNSPRPPASLLSLLFSCLSSRADTTPVLNSYQKALSEQPTHPALHYTEFKLVAGICFAVGGILVVSSMWALGVTGTYLGDYFVCQALLA
jgi:hypothetical protein